MQRVQILVGKMKIVEPAERLLLRRRWETFDLGAEAALRQFGYAIQRAGQKLAMHGLSRLGTNDERGGKENGKASEDSNDDTSLWTHTPGYV